MQQSQQRGLPAQATHKTPVRQTITCPPAEETLKAFVNGVCERLCEEGTQVIEARQGFGNFFKAVVGAMVSHANRKEAK